MVSQAVSLVTVNIPTVLGLVSGISIHCINQYLVRAVLDLPCRALLQCRAFVAETLNVQVNLVVAEGATHEQVQLHPAQEDHHHSTR